MDDDVAAISRLAESAASANDIQQLKSQLETRNARPWNAACYEAVILACLSNPTAEILRIATALVSEVNWELHPEHSTRIFNKLLAIPRSDDKLSADVLPELFEFCSAFKANIEPSLTSEISIGSCQLAFATLKHYSSSGACISSALHSLAIWDALPPEEKSQVLAALLELLRSQPDIQWYREKDQQWLQPFLAFLSPFLRAIRSITDFQCCSSIILELYDYCSQQAFFFDFGGQTIFYTLTTLIIDEFIGEKAKDVTKLASLKIFLPVLLCHAFVSDQEADRRYLPYKRRADEVLKNEFLTHAPILCVPYAEKLCQLYLKTKDISYLKALIAIYETGNKNTMALVASYKLDFLKCLSKPDESLFSVVHLLMNMMHDRVDLTEHIPFFESMLSSHSTATSGAALLQSCASNSPGCLRGLGHTYCDRFLREAGVTEPHSYALLLSLYATIATFSEVEHIFKAETGRVMGILQEDAKGTTDYAYVNELLRSWRVPARRYPSTLRSRENWLEDIKKIPQLTETVEELLDILRNPDRNHLPEKGETNEYPQINGFLPTMSKGPKAQVLNQARKDAKRPMSADNARRTNRMHPKTGDGWSYAPEIRPHTAEPKKTKVKPPKRTAAATTIPSKFDIALFCLADVSSETAALQRSLEISGYKTTLERIDIGNPSPATVESKTVICAVTKNFIRSTTAKRQLLLIENLRKPLIPLLFDRCQWPPDGTLRNSFAREQPINCYYADQMAWDGQEFEELLARLAKFLPSVRQLRKNSDPIKAAPKSALKRVSSAPKLYSDVAPKQVHFDSTPKELNAQAVSVDIRVSPATPDSLTSLESREVQNVAVADNGPKFTEERPTRLPRIVLSNRQGLERHRKTASLAEAQLDAGNESNKNQNRRRSFPDKSFSHSTSDLSKSPKPFTKTNHSLLQKAVLANHQRSTALASKEETLNQFAKPVAAASPSTVIKKTSPANVRIHGQEQQPALRRNRNSFVYEPEAKFRQQKRAELGGPETVNIVSDDLPKLPSLYRQTIQKRF